MDSNQINNLEPHGVNISFFLSYLFKRKYLYLTVIVLSILISFIYTSNLNDKYEGVINLKKENDIANFEFITQYNLIIEKLDLGSPISSNNLYELALAKFNDGKFLYDQFSIINSEKSSKLNINEKDFFIRNEVSKIRIAPKQMSKLEKELWKQDNFTLLHNVIMETNDRIELIKTLDLLATNANNQIKFTLIDQIQTMQKQSLLKTNKAIEELNQQIITKERKIHNRLQQEAEYLKSQILLARNLNIKFPKTYENDDGLAMLIAQKTGEEDYTHHFNDGYAILEAQLLEKNELINNDDQFNKYAQIFIFDDLIQLESKKKRALAEFYDIEYSEKLRSIKLDAFKYNKESIIINKIGINHYLINIIIIFSSFILLTVILLLSAIASYNRN